MPSRPRGAQQEGCGHRLTFVFRVLLEEIQTFGVFEKLEQHIKSYLVARDPPGLFSLVFQRLERVRFLSTSFLCTREPGWCVFQLHRGFGQFGQAPRPTLFCFPRFLTIQFRNLMLIVLDWLVICFPFFGYLVVVLLKMNYYLFLIFHLLNGLHCIWPSVNPSYALPSILSLFFPDPFCVFLTPSSLILSFLVHDQPCLQPPALKVIYVWILVFL